MKKSQFTSLLIFSPEFNLKTYNSVTFLLNLLKLELKQNLITCRQVRGNSKNGYNCYEKRNRYNKICEDICLLYTY